MMNSVLLFIFYLSAIIIFQAMIGYPVSMRLFQKILKPAEHPVDYSHKPTVTVMVTAHNEEKVIVAKLDNITAQDYPADKIKFLIASDNSSDRTNDLVDEYIRSHPEHDIRLFNVRERKGKTNAQNEAQKTVDTEFLVMTDANGMLAKDAVSELMASFVSEDIYYVCGRLTLENNSESEVSKSEKTYWDSDMVLRDIESRLKTITGGNGALYAIRNDQYIDFRPIVSHDTWFPLYYSLDHKIARLNKNALVYEKAGVTLEDEFSRKVRMNRRLLERILPFFKILNFFEYGWFTYFYLGHRTCRYLLWLAHLLVLVSNIFLADYSVFYLLVLVFQILFYLLALLQYLFKADNKYLRMIYYYTVFIAAQWVGFFNIITGRAKPFWDKAETTRS